ncbi:HAMP domain-containing histidine kinase [Clostridium formicaceticum]|uniref:histidine kinase n=1 Tax=Clostridium formicaceticum TaxID=1497 RepID=A0AAC9WIA3_9CLOT|nr:HAMP domain-containing histidine kinase [Clostridium formicaceticum]AOY77953.1 hypothetical protein BJL90_20050 [Clostridium formicaceticum]ARE88575.1 Alginate biosynthesis sensor protein KinB [Clostridium formicaceticum]
MKRSIKSKILLLFLVVLVIFALTSLWSSKNFFTLSNSIDDIMRANYKSVVAAQNMVVALERQDSAILSYMFTNENETFIHFKENEVKFLRDLAIAEGNITERGEKEVVEEIHDAYVIFLEKVRLLSNIQSNEGQEAAKNFYFNNVFPAFERAKELSRNLQLLNQEAMLRLKDQAHNTAEKATYSTLSIALITTIVGSILAWVSIHKTIQPIQELIEKVKKIAEGDYDQQIYIKGSGEISVLADEFNVMAKKLSSYEQLNIKRLMKEKKKAEAIVEGISDGIIVTDINHKITLVNRAAEKIFGVKETDALERHFLEVAKHEEVFKIIEEVENVQKNTDKKPLREVAISLRQNEKYKHYRIQVLPIGDKFKEFIGVVTLIQDITKLKEIDEMKSDFISTVSHEFRTPLTSMSMGTGLLLEGIPGPLTENQKELVEAMKEDQERLKNLVNDLLDLSRIESGKIEMNIRGNELKKIVEESVKAFEHQAKDKNIELSYCIEENLPLVRADFNKVSWILINLIGNAMRYTPRDGSGKIQIEGKRTGSIVLVSVSDNGIGIPQEYRKKIFEKFVQVKDREGNPTGGTGLGLAICKEIIEAHGGQIWVKSKLGKGSSFYFTLAIEKS